MIKFGSLYFQIAGMCELTNFLGQGVLISCFLDVLIGFQIYKCLFLQQILVELLNIF